jgi:hypothetical protein
MPSTPLLRSSSSHAPTGPGHRSADEGAMSPTAAPIYRPLQPGGFPLTAKAGGAIAAPRAPRCYGKPPRRSVRLPHGSGFFVYACPLVGHVKRLIPHARGLLPQARGLLPHVRGLLVRVRGLLPRRSGFLPHASRLLPRVRGLLPRGSGFLPHASRFLPHVSDWLRPGARRAQPSRATSYTSATPALMLVKTRLRPSGARIGCT